MPFFTKKEDSKSKSEIDITKKDNKNELKNENIENNDTVKENCNSTEDSFMNNLDDFDDLEELESLSSGIAENTNELEKTIETNSETSESETSESETTNKEVEKQKINIANTFEDIKNKITKKDKIDKFSDSESIKLYVLTDRYSDRVLSYFRDKGLKVSKMTNKIADIRKELLLAQMISQSDCLRLVIIESGLGKFTGLGTRKELVDLLGIVNDKLSISIFYTESLIKSDTELQYEDAYFRIDWNKYISTASTVATLLRFGETYGYQNKIQEVKDYSSELTKQRINISNFLNKSYDKTDKTMGLAIPEIADRGVTSLDKMIEGLNSDKYQNIRSFKVKY